MQSVVMYSKSWLQGDSGKIPDLSKMLSIYRRGHKSIVRMGKTHHQRKNILNVFLLDLSRLTIMIVIFFY